MKKLLSFILILCSIVVPLSQTFAQSSSPKFGVKERPKLVVGIVVDQMRYDYLTRFYDKFGDGGFKRMMREGYNCKNNHFNYIPTYTGPGHAAVYTGTTPKYHGIISNNWYDKVEKKSVYCVNDDNFKAVGTTDEYSHVSPNRMLVTTVTDELRLHTQQRSKVIGIALKDRGAVLPAGHSANAAYWFQGAEEGNWVTSTYYMDELPKWVQDFNKSDNVEKYFKEWNTLLPIDSYKESGPDLNNFENGFRGKETATFPYDLDKLKSENGGFDILKSTPYGNSMTVDFAIEALVAENLGKDNETDFLTISFSSPDYIGHNFGVNAKEIQDNYLRLDKDLERLFKELDAKVGNGEYTVFLTSDHAAVHVPAFLQSQKIAADYYDLNAFKRKLTVFMARTYGASDLVEYAGDFQIFLNRNKLKELKLDLQSVQEAIVEEIIGYDLIDKAYSASSLRSSSFNDGMEKLLQNGYNQKRSGDVLVILNPAVISRGRKGTTHGSGYTYDTHVPLLFFGHGIKQGETYQRTEITDVAPTISALLDIAFPNASIGKPLDFVFD